MGFTGGIPLFHSGIWELEFGFRCKRHYIGCVKAVANGLIFVGGAGAKASQLQAHGRTLAESALNSSCLPLLCATFAVVECKAAQFGFHHGAAQSGFCCPHIGVNHSVGAHLGVAEDYLHHTCAGLAVVVGNGEEHVMLAVGEEIHERVVKHELDLLEVAPFMGEVLI